MRPPLIPQTVPIHGHEPEYIKILKTLFNTLVEFREPGNNRIPIAIFMCLPSRKDFPEYFEIIHRPISMYEIRKRIETGVYKSIDPCLEDFKLMFNNCRTFNEDGSIIFNDAVEMEELLFKKYDQLVPRKGRNTNSTSIYSNNDSPKPKSHPHARAAATPTTTTQTTTVPSSSPAPFESSTTTTNTNNSTNTNQVAPQAMTPTPASKRYPKKSNSTITSNNINHNSSDNNLVTHYNSTPLHGHQSQLSQSTKYTNGLTSDADSNSNSNHFSSCNGNTNDSFIINHNFHNDTSIDSNSNLSIGPNASTTTNEKSTTKRHKRDPDAPKKRLLTGYIIYAAEVRKEYVDKHPNQDFGYISRLIGNDWKALSKDLRIKYDQRALAHNKRMREKAIMDSMMTTQPDGQAQFSYNHNQPYPPNQQHATSMTNGSKTPKMTKRRLAKLAEEQARMHTSSAPYMNHDNSFSSPMRQHDRPSQMVTQAAGSSTQRSYSYSTNQCNHAVQFAGKSVKVEASTQTAPFRFVEPPTRRHHAYAENFRRYIASMDVSNMDSLDEETACLEKPPEPVDTWLGAGTGRHESTDAALWALRDFMLQDSETMRLNMQPYLCYNRPV